jgi:ketosteroid isomerase-like protein
VRDRVAKGYFKQLLCVLLIVGLSHSLWAKNQEESIMSIEQEKALKTVELMTESFHDKNISGVLGSYEPGAAVMFDPGNPVTDIEVLKQMFEGAFQINPKFEYPKGHEVYIANGIALHIAPWLMTARAPDGAMISKSGLSVAVLRKQSSGEWLMVLDNPNGQLLMETH